MPTRCRWCDGSSRRRDDRPASATLSEDVRLRLAAILARESVMSSHRRRCALALNGLAALSRERSTPQDRDDSHALPEEQTRVAYVAVCHHRAC